MNRILTALLSTVFLCATVSYAQQTPSGETTPPETQSPTPNQTSPSPAQSSPVPSTSAPAAQAVPAATPARIAAGSVIPVQLTKTVDAKKAKTGDEVVAKVTQDLKNNAGMVIVPKDTKVVGHVTEAQPHNKEQKESQLAIAFDQAVLKNGETMQMPMSIQAIIAPPNQNPQNNAQNAAPSSGYPGGGTPSGGAQAGMPAGSSQGSMGGSTAGSTPAPQEMPQDNGNAQAGSQARPPITGNTQGVVGISNLNLSAAANRTQGSVVTSEKNNVKLESGTFMLLRVK